MITIDSAISFLLLGAAFAEPGAPRARDGPLHQPSASYCIEGVSVLQRRSVQHARRALQSDILELAAWCCRLDSPEPPSVVRQRRRVIPLYLPFSVVR
ncbi:hypothetical protein NDU88_004303 [Pleurodeles waltl]|uniref:Secreted protein n=1 Tax=Pleurodeles waltl TaxID=8319 RepID=A0AAV7LHN2_PLEWA|nr:hypothetical protein NDU88_004303 [Pleurodeles waltl]